MAEGSVKQVLEKEVTCPLCLDILQEPKKLPCDHVYCRACLDRLANRSFNAATPISCPECRTPAQIPNGNVSNFPTAFRLNRLIEAFQRVEVKEATAVPEKVEEAKCKIHQTQPLALYCDTCKRLLCRDCVLTTNEHADHTYGFIDKMKENLLAKLKGTVSAVESLSQHLSKAVYEMAHVENEISSSATHCQHEIEKAYELLHQKLQESAKRMKEDASQRFERSSFPFSQKKKEMLSINGEITALISQAKEIFLAGDTKSLMQYVAIQQELEQLQVKLGQTTVNVPERPPLITPDVVSGEVFEQQLEKLNTLCAFDPMKWQLTTESVLADVQVGQRYTLSIERMKSGSKLWRSISSESTKGIFKCKAELLCIANNQTVEGEIQQSSQYHFLVTINPLARGRHTLSIKVNGAHIANSPFAVFVQIQPTQIKQPVTEIAELRNPVSLYTIEGEDGNIIIAERKRGIIKISPSHAISIVCEIQGVEELTFDPQSDVIYATTWDNHKVHKLSSGGSLIKTVGGHGNLPGQFDLPNGLRVSKKSELYVCDSRNSRIQVFDVDLNFKRIFGKAKRLFSFPSGIDFDVDGRVYVVEYGSHRLQVFASNEELLFTVGNTQSLQLNRPVSVVAHRGLVYITEMGNHQVTAITSSGQCVAQFGHDNLRSPEGIAIDEDGYIYVTSHHSKVFVF